MAFSSMLVQIELCNNVRIVAKLWRNLFPIQMIDEKLYGSFSPHERFLFHETDDAAVFKWFDEGLGDVVPTKKSNFPAL